MFCGRISVLAAISNYQVIWVGWAEVRWTMFASARH